MPYLTTTIRGSRARIINSGLIYVIGSSKAKRYKIGYTCQKDVYKRYNTIRSKLKRERSELILDYVRAYHTADVLADERALHVTFASKAVGGEWFALDASDLIYIVRGWKN